MLSLNEKKKEGSCSAVNARCRIKRESLQKMLYPRSLRSEFGDVVFGRAPFQLMALLHTHRWLHRLGVYHKI